MQIEIIGFYPKRIKLWKNFRGTLAIRVISTGSFFLKGIGVTVKNNEIYLYPPNFSANYEGKKIRVPVFSFENDSINRAFRDSLNMKAREFLESEIGKDFAEIKLKE